MTTIISHILQNFNWTDQLKQTFLLLEEKNGKRTINDYIELWLKNSRVQENSVFSKTLISTFDISNVGVYLILKEWYSKEETLRVKL